jgi:hypothetical protein
VSLAEDQHPVGDLGPHGQHEAFGEAVRPRTPRRNLDHLKSRVGQDRVERRRELPGPITDQEPKPSDLLAEVHDEVTGLLGRPRPVGMPGHTQHVQIPVTSLEGGAEPAGRVRAPGGGRKPATENDPGLGPALRALVDPQTRGDPESPLVWTTKSTRRSSCAFVDPDPAAERHGVLQEDHRRPDRRVLDDSG